MLLSINKLKRFMCTMNSSIQKVSTIYSSGDWLSGEDYLSKLENGIGITPLNVAQAAAQCYDFLQNDDEKKVVVTFVYNHSVQVKFRFTKRRKTLSKYDMLYIIYHIRIMFLYTEMPRKTVRAMIALSDFYIDLIRRGEEIPWLL